MSFDTVVEIIVDTVHCQPEHVKPEAELSALGIGSLEAITVIFELEEAFDIEIPNEVIPSILTVNDIMVRLEEARQ